MLIRKAFKFKLEPTTEQVERLCVLVGHARYVWNRALRHGLDELYAGRRVPSAFDLNKLITVWKKEPETEWLKEAYTDNLQQKCADLGEAWKRCFDKNLDAEKPRFKKKGKSQDSIRFVNFNKYCQIANRRVKLPAKLGYIKFRKSRSITGTIKNCTITRKSVDWYISFQTEQEIDKPVHPSGSCVGVDVGIAKFATLSTGLVYEPVNSFRKREKSLAKAQGQLSRKVKFSANWQKQQARVNNLHSKIAACRLDYLHKTSTEISKNHAMVAIEDLKVSNMSKSAKGTTEQHGKNVKAKSGLNKSILDQGWYEFRRQLDYKQQWRGGIVVAVPAQYTSQTCPICEYVSKDNRKTQSRFSCVACGHTENADIVGARNILERGHRLLACGESSLEVSVKQEPVGNRERVPTQRGIAS